MITDSLQVFKSIPEIRAASYPELFSLTDIRRKVSTRVSCLIYKRYHYQEEVIYIYIKKRVFTLLKQLHILSYLMIIKNS